MRSGISWMLVLVPMIVTLLEFCRANGRALQNSMLSYEN